jgi:hypothetical protein
MEFLDKLPLPKRLNSQVWLFALPSALMSFEKRQKVPPLPIGKGRFAGVPLLGAGLGILIWDFVNRQQGNELHLFGPIGRRVRNPATIGGIIGLAGVGLLARSTVLTVYSIALLVAEQTERIEVEAPDLESFVPGR